MKEFRLALILEDMEGNVVSKKPINSAWSVNDEEITQAQPNMFMLDEVSEILIHALKLNLDKSVVKEMLEEYMSEGE